MAAPRFPDAAAAAHQPFRPSLDLERFTVLTQICAASGSPATIEALLDAFVEDGQLRVGEMAGSLRACDLGALAAHAHKFKGSSSTIGAVALSDAAAGLHRQAAFAAGRSTVEPSDVKDLGRLLDLTVAEFRRAEVALRTAVPVRR